MTRDRWPPFDSKWNVPGFISNKYLQINHYRTKSVEENQAKAKLVRHGNLPYFRTPKVLNQIEELSQNTTLDEEAIIFLLKKRGNQ